MDGVPDLSALLKGKLQLLSKKSIPADVQGSTSSDAGRASKEGAPGLVDKDVGAEPPASSPKKKKKSKKPRRKATEELPLEEIASLDETSEGLEARKGERGMKRPYEGATSSIDRGEAPAVGRERDIRSSVESDRSEAAPEDRPRKKKKKKSVEAEPRPSDAETALVEVVAGGDVSLETPLEEREVSARGSDPVTGERSIPDPSARKGFRSEGSTVRRKKIEFPDRVEFSYNEMTPLILNPLRCAELTRQIRGGTKEMPQLDDLYFKNEYIDAASSRARAIAAHSHLRWPDLSRGWIRRQEAQIARVDWESRLPVVLGPRKSCLSLFTRKQQKLLDEARKMDGVPDLSALLKGKLQLLSKKSIPADVQGSTRSDAGRASKEGALGLVDKDVGAEPPASSPRRRRARNPGGKQPKSFLLKRSLLSTKPPRAPAVGREGATRGSVESDHSEAAPEDHPRKKKKKKKSIEAEPRPSDVETGLVEVVARGDVSLETPPEEREVSARGSDPVTGERSIPDPSARKGSRSEGSTVRWKKIEFPDRVEFSYNETTP
ncbi:hypothetical protein F2Q69_00051120 [Brassica cretica]|uniref:Uncharacterized protein n=1 Tax=Brassica cretica TaxID=69181 RepID=A0A8S9PQA7_BRACR|nr:hypothetical protein F2Q69_00051120 [Brassica cretica]